MCRQPETKEALLLKTRDLSHTTAKWSFEMCLLTKIKAQSCIPLEEGAVGFGLDVGSILYQHLHMVKTSPFNGNMEG